MIEPENVPTSPDPEAGQSSPETAATDTPQIPDAPAMSPEPVQLVSVDAPLDIPVPPPTIDVIEPVTPDVIEPAVVDPETAQTEGVVAVDKPDRRLPEPSADLHPDVATREAAPVEGWQPASHIGEPDPSRVASKGPVDMSDAAHADTNEA